LYITSFYIALNGILTYHMLNAEKYAKARPK
jgi:hypothetical protein